MRAARVESKKSTAPTYIAKKTIRTKTTIVVPMSSLLVGQTTFENSFWTPTKKSRPSLKIFTIYFLHNVSELYLAGQEGLEPPTIRFGVCRSTIRATGLPKIILFRFFMRTMLTTT